MILDRLENADTYAAGHPRLAAAFAYLRSTDLANLALGRHDIDGGKIFALVQEYRTRLPAEGFWESHRAYIDVQYVISGLERMGYANIASLAPRGPYDGGKDLLVYDGTGDFFNVPAGSFTVFAPADAHMPCMAAGESSQVKKVVIKVAV